MAITPHTDLRLLKVPINIDNQNQLTFANVNAQYNYFNSLDKLEVDNFTYQRKDGIIRYPAHIDSIINYNYCMYQNSNYTNKWFYAFITGMSYINDNMTEISITTDVYQTWQFDIDVKTSYVEREHVNDDTIGKNTYPESLETGEYSILESLEIGLPIVSDDSRKEYYFTCIMSSWDPFEQKPTSSRMCGVDQGCSFFVMGEYRSVSYFMGMMATQSKNDAIIGAFVIPIELFYYGDYTQPIPSTWWDYMFESGGLSYYAYKKLDSTIVGGTYFKQAIKMNEPTFSPASTTIGYTPKNNKLLCYPYSYIEISNNNGGNAIFRYEDFDTSQTLGFIKFLQVGTITPGCSITLIPEYYKNKNYNYEESVPMGKLPICSYQVDMYTNWLTQNSLQCQLSVGESLLSTAVGASTGNPIAIASGLMGIANTLAEVDKQSKVPPQAQGNINNGDVCYSSDNLRYTIYKKSIKKEYAEKIDNYFSMFGYRVNITKVPNIYGRTNWNYVKTIDVNIEGYIPQTDLQAIKDMFNKGVTFWHNPLTFLDYSQTNAIVS
ncbi:MAG: hypothetical protein IIZ67_06225 [Bacilli bacterium]|nr:hypothetical protein [Bacilli bacterium]